MHDNRLTDQRTITVGKPASLRVLGAANICEIRFMTWAFTTLPCLVCLNFEATQLTINNWTLNTRETYNATASAANPVYCDLLSEAPPGLGGYKRQRKQKDNNRTSE